MLTTLWQALSPLTLARAAAEAAPPPFDPSSISDLYVWLDWQDGAETDDGGYRQAVNGETVARWRDLSGNGNHFTTVSGEYWREPTWYAGQGVYFNGTDDFLQRDWAGGDFLGDLTILIDVQSFDTSRVNGVLAQRNAGTATAALGLNIGSSSGNGVGQWYYGDGSDWCIAGTGAVPSQPVRFTLRRENVAGTNYLVHRQNGVQVATASSWRTPNGGFQPLRLGASTAAGGGEFEPMQGTIRRVLIYTRALDSTEIGQIESLTF
jgi:hypothetical protein